MRFPFTKVEGLGNHFVLVDEREAGTADWDALAPRFCARGTGIGADGLLVAAQPRTPDAAVTMRMFNPDGTEDMCGNGLRCVAHRECALRGGERRRFVVDTLCGPRDVEVLELGPASATVSTDMGAPILAPEQLPARFPGDSVLGVPMEVCGQTLHVHLVSTGTPHCVVFGDHPDNETFRTLSAQLETAPVFPERISVMWAHCDGPSSIRLRIWERAVGETAACGTGACAVAFAGILAGRVTSPVTVAMPGGNLVVRYEPKTGRLRQVGPSRVVYRGEWAGG